MYDHYIFIDTETSGVPKRWDQPVLKEKNWPYIIQIAWVIYDLDGKFIKEESHYLRNPGVKLDPKSQQVHGITLEKLEKRGTSKHGILTRLFKDLQRYNALLIGHFAEFDMKMLAVENLRQDIRFDLDKIPTFCTMVNSREQNQNPLRTYPGLGDLYFYYFTKSMRKEHHALYDARATAMVFFEMKKAGRFSENAIEYFTFTNTEESKDNQNKTKGKSLFKGINKLLSSFIKL